MNDPEDDSDSIETMETKTTTIRTNANGQHKGRESSENMVRGSHKETQRTHEVANP